MTFVNARRPRSRRCRSSTSSTARPSCSTRSAACPSCGCGCRRCSRSTPRRPTRRRWSARRSTSRPRASSRACSSPRPPGTRAVAVLREHHFLVLTGPPEMGKTAIARMLGLALLTEGWEVHECTRPGAGRGALRPRAPAAVHRRRRVRLDRVPARTPPSAGRRDLDRILRATDEHALARVDLAAGAAARRACGACTASAAASASRSRPRCRSTRRALGPEEKTLILFRHARAADLAARAARADPRRTARRSSSTRTSRPSGSAASSRAARRDGEAAIDARADRADRGDGGLLRRARARAPRAAAGDARLAARAGRRARPRRRAAPARDERAAEGARPTSSTGSPTTSCG